MKIIGGDPYLTFTLPQKLDIGYIEIILKLSLDSQ